MSNFITVKSYEAPLVNEREVLRYAGCKDANDQIQKLLKECLGELEGKLCYKVCYRAFDLSIAEDKCDFGVFCAYSKSLAKNLNGCKKVILFAATVGIEIDRLILKYSRIAPAKALMLQAIGAERVEALCDAFCSDVAREYNTKICPRFSPGYADLKLEIQKNVFDILECSKHIGISLNESLLMSPSKSVTAFIGLKDSGDKNGV